MDSPKGTGVVSNISKLPPWQTRKKQKSTNDWSIIYKNIHGLLNKKNTENCISDETRCRAFGRIFEIKIGEVSDF